MKKLREGERIEERILKKLFSFLKSSSRIRNDYNASASRSLHLAGISGTWNILLGLGKIISGLLSLSGFICVSGCYTLGMVVARYCVLTGAVRSKDVREQQRYYKLSGSILIIASLLYIAYSGWAYYHPKYTVYPKYIALAIATFTFTEIILNIRGVLISRRDGTLLVHALKTINLAASLISLVLTQSAILSIAQGVITTLLPMCFWGSWPEDVLHFLACSCAGE